jgi:mycothiol synthase
MMPPIDVSVRHFTWNDVAALGGLQGDSHPDAAAAVERWLRQPNLLPERDCLIASIDEVLMGYAYVVVEPALSRGVLLWDVGQRRGASAAEKPLLDAAIAHARELGLAVLQEDIPETNTARQALLVASGMTRVRTHRHLRRDAASMTRIALPPGTSLRMTSQADVEAVTNLQNAAFEGSWGFSPNTPDEITYRVFTLPVAPPDGVVLLEAGGLLVGYCWTEREEGGSPGIISMVGVPPDKQGQGFGLAVTAAGIDHLVEVGATPIEITVDAENAPAIRVYQGLGFEDRWRSLWYELALT